MDPSAHAHHDQPAPHGQNKHAGHDPGVFRRQFWIVLALTIPVVIWSAVLTNLPKLFTVGILAWCSFDSFLVDLSTKSVAE